MSVSIWILQLTIILAEARLLVQEEEQISRDSKMIMRHT
jgi:hypothetical protein